MIYNFPSMKHHDKAQSAEENLLTNLAPINVNSFSTRAASLFDLMKLNTR